jgi:drug/metabolite transporter (DMT)-like permease
MIDYHAAPRPLLGIALKVISTLAFAGMITIVKLVSDRYPIGEMVFFRSFFALIPVLIWVGWRGEIPGVFRTSNFRGHLVRCFAGTGGMFCGFAAISFMPIADATAIGYAAPLITVMLGYFLLGENVRVYRWSAVVVGFLGVLTILSDYFGPEAHTGGTAVEIGAIFAIVGAFFSGLAATQVRSLTRFESAGTIVIYFSLLTSIAALVTVPFGWVMPTPGDAALLVLAGIFGGMGQVLQTLSYRHGEVSVVAPFEYTSMIWILAVSLVIFGTWPTPVVLLGTAIIIAADLFVIYREHRLGIERRQSKQAQPPTAPLG